jgi:hypothetical protein
MEQIWDKVNGRTRARRTIGDLNRQATTRALLCSGGLSVLPYCEHNCSDFLQWSKTSSKRKRGSKESSDGILSSFIVATGSTLQSYKSAARRA